VESELLRILTQGGAIAVLAVIVVLFIKGQIVSKPTYDKTAETYKESLNRILEADKENREADREISRELLGLLKAINGRFKGKG